MSQSVASSTMAPSTFLADETVYSQNFDATYTKSDYLRNAYYYLSHRKSLLSLWQNLSYQDSAFDETVPTDSIPSRDLVSPLGDTNMRELEYAQWDLTGNVVSNLGQLYEHAEFVKPVFESSLKHIASECNLTIREGDTNESTVESGLVLCPMKMADRATEKAREEYSKVDPGPPCAWLFDILRASFVCDTEEQIRAVYDLIGFDSHFQVIRVKNRFKTPTTAGFRDILINVMLEDIGPTGLMTHFICEIQITHIDLRQYEIENDTRALYRFFRPLTAGSGESQESKIKLLEKVVSATSPILNAIGAASTDIDRDITECIRALSKQALEGDNLSDQEDWIDVLESVAEFELAEKLQRRLIKLEMKRYGEQNQMVSDALLKLGGLLKAQNELEQAAAVYQAAAVMKNDLLGEYDAQVADALFCMAEVRTLQGKFDAAVPLHEQVLLIRRKLYFRDNPDIAVSLTKLAEIMEAQDNHGEAMSYYSQALSVWQAVYGENSPFVAACMNSLALLLDSTGKSHEAKAMFERCVAICKVLYSEDHTSVASAMNNLALCLKKLGEYEEAYQLYEQALAIRRARYGEKHPAVATTLNNLGLLLKQQQRYDEAKALYLQALQIRREVLGPNHIDVASSLSNLALLHEALGNFGEALFLHENARTMRISILGPEHPTVASTLVNMALVHQKMKAFDEARALFEKAISIYELYPIQTTEGVAPHPEIATVRGYLRTLEEVAAAEELLEGSEDEEKSQALSEHSGSSRSLIGSTKNPLTAAVGVASAAPPLGVRLHRSEHGRLALSLRTMALTLQDRGETEAAQPFLEQSLGLLLALSGGKPDHSEACIQGIVFLAILYRELGRYKLSTELFRKALEEYKKIQSETTYNCINTQLELGIALVQYRMFKEGFSALSECLALSQSIDDPRLESDVRAALGAFYSETNDLSLAKTELEQCLQLRIGLFGETHRLVAAALVELGQIYRLKAEFTSAREYYEDALKIYVDVMEQEKEKGYEKTAMAGVKGYRRQRGAVQKDIALTHRRIGLAYKEENTWVLAFASLLKSIEMYRTAQCGLAADSLELASTLYEAAHVAIRLPASVEGGGLESAVGMLSRCLEIREKRLGPSHRDTHQTKLDLAVKLRMNAKHLSILSQCAYMRSVNLSALGGNVRWSEEYVSLAASGTNASYDSGLAIVLLESAAEAFEHAATDSGEYNLRELANVYVELGGILTEEQMWTTAAPVFEKLLETYRRIYSQGQGSAAYSSDVALITDPSVRELVLSERSATSSVGVGYADERSNPMLGATESMADSELGGRVISRVFPPDMRADGEDTAAALAAAALVCMRCNRLKRAKDLFLEAIEIRTRIGQANSLVTAELLSNFGELREREKKYNKAKELHERAYEIRLKLVGDDHPLLADSLEELGHLRLLNNKLDKAEGCFRQAAAIRRNASAKLRRQGGQATNVTMGETAAERKAYSAATWSAELSEIDIRVVYSLIDLSMVFKKKGETHLAKELLEEAVEIQKSIAVGNNVVVYSSVLTALAQLYIDEGLYHEARGLLEESLQLREEALGSQHRLVVEVLHLLAHTLDCLQMLSEAQSVLEQALSIYIHINQTEYCEDVANTYAELGRLFFHRNQFAISISYFKKALEVWMKLKGIESSQVTDAMLNLAFAYKKNDEVAESRNTYEQAAAILRRRHGYNHPDVASVLASLSSLSFYEKKYEEALDYSKQVLKIRKKIYGRDNAEVINTTANQAIIYEKLLMYKNAHKLCIRVLQWREERLTEDDPLISTALIALADSFRRLGNISKAFEYNTRAIEHMRLHLGEAHEATIQRVAVAGELYRVEGRYIDAERQLRYATDTALVSANNEIRPYAMPIILQLAGVARILGKYIESERWYRMLLTAQEEMFGHSTVEVATTLSSLGVLLMEQYKLKEASDYLDESLTIRSQVYGNRHPDVASSLNNIGSLLDLLGRHEEAKIKFEQALEIRVQIYGSKHPSVAQSLNNIANMMCSVGNYDEAESLFMLSQSILSKLFGDNHPEYSVTLNNLAGLMDARGEVERSKYLHEQSYSIRREVYGDSHPLCAVSMNNIGGCELMQNKLSEAARLFQEAINIRRRVHGGDRTVPVAEGFSNQASVYMAEGRYQIAAKLQRQASQIMEDILGYHHPSTINIKGNLGISCRRNGETSTGNLLLREASEFLANNLYPDEHPWVKKFRGEAEAHGDFGSSVGGNSGAGSAERPTTVPPPARLPITGSQRTLQSQESGGASALRPAMLTGGQDASSMKDIAHRSPARMKLDRYESYNDNDSVASHNLDESEHNSLQYSTNGDESFLISSESNRDASRSFGYTDDNSNSLYGNSFQERTFDDESTVGGQSHSFAEIAESGVRIIPGRKREPDYDQSLPVLPRLLPKSNSTDTVEPDAHSDDSEEHKAAAVTKDSFGDGLDREVSRVVKRKEAKRNDPNAPLVPKGYYRSESDQSNQSDGSASNMSESSDAPHQRQMSRGLGSMISMDVIDLDDLRKGDTTPTPRVETVAEEAPQDEVDTRGQAEEAQEDEVTVVSNEPGAVYAPFVGKK